jgi:hypothetical protein
MSDLPPPPVDPDWSVPTPRPATGPPRRPGAVTGAAGILIVAGALSLIVGLLGMSGNRLDLELPLLEGRSAERIFLVALVVQGALALATGWLVLRLHPVGRILGIVLASLGIVAGLAQLRSTGTSGLLALALNAFVLYGLIAYGFVFRSGSSPR